ncbi:S9 family peptidase [Ectopseudomonas mendocina]|uniref:Alpha/beta hydrolase n=1 Tax=Ectopseudomonas mendocina TaxID=300 RepID=A0A2R3QV14_ECTME|nr:alpha/beta fold hydrolase [Pseudomonas mendocina]AVO55573.1 alpha/beta hydrolase [Pseudomonas mendocina]
MSAHSQTLEILVDDEAIAATLLSPPAKVPGVLFVHGWGGSQQRDLARARSIAGLGCVCLTFDLRGHEKTIAAKESVTRAHNLADIIAAYDRLAEHPAVDSDCIAVIGSSYGGYLSTLLSTQRTVKWLALRVPALYWDEQWHTPKGQLDTMRLQEYRRRPLRAEDNRALRACSAFSGDVLLVESEHDDFVPHATLMSYRAAFDKAHSLTHRILDGADHALSEDRDQQAYTQILGNWISEMVIGARVGNYPHQLVRYS